MERFVGRHAALQCVGAHVPYTLRWFPHYEKAARGIRAWDRCSVREQEACILERMREMVDYAYREHAFYARHYRQRGFDPACLRTFEDIARIPLVTKHDLSAVPLEERTLPARGYRMTNTGGTSGKPLVFMVSKRSDGIEWAHMHYMWSRLGYRTRMTKLAFRGADIGDRPLVFGLGQNEYAVNIYRDPREVARAVSVLARRGVVRFLHGYPSAMSEFAAFCARHEPDLAQALRRTLKGALLGSEYPSQAQRTRIEEVFGVPTLSWYGHSERVVLAVEEERYRYRPLHSYGYCEAVPVDGGRTHLVGTSFTNRATPFIRYDTEDSIEPVRFDGPLLERFMITEGRDSDFVVDKNGHRISLTGLIFGRHHTVFGKAQFVQIRQTEPGRATFLVTPLEYGGSEGADWLDAFDLDNVNMEFALEVVEAPVRSASGKVPLLVKD